jgi:acylglycerol lipase
MRLDRRAFLLGAAGLPLTGCASALQPMGPPVAEPRLDTGTLVTADGLRLPMRVWRPDGAAPTAAVLALHGFNDYSNGFDTPARVWAARGIATYAYDQRGFGAAPNTGVWPGTETLIADASAAVRLVRREAGGKPLYLLGESMGGAVAILAAGQFQPVAGTILVAPAVWGFETMGFFPRTALRLAYAAVPGMVLHPPRELKIRASDNIEMLRAMGRDPLVIKGARVDALYGLTDLMGAALGHIGRMRTPVLALYGANEEVLPPGPVADAIQAFHRLPGARLAVYPQGFHMLLRDLNAALPITDIASWIADPRAPLPSGAEKTVVA